MDRNGFTFSNTGGRGGALGEHEKVLYEMVTQEIREHLKPAKSNDIVER